MIRLAILEAPGLGDWLVLGILDSPSGGGIDLLVGSKVIIALALECILFAVLGAIVGLVGIRSRRAATPAVVAFCLAVLLQALFSIRVEII